MSHAARLRPLVLLVAAVLPIRPSLARPTTSEPGRETRLLEVGLAGGSPSTGREAFAPGTSRGDDPLPEELVAWIAAESPVLLLGMGDSVTRGYGASDPSRSTFRLVEAQLAGKLRGRAGFRFLSRNLAVDGSTSCDHLQDQVPLLRRKMKDLLEVVAATGEDPRRWNERLRVVILVTSGGNDILHGAGEPAPSPCAMYGCTATAGRAWSIGFGRRLESLVTALDISFPGRFRLYLGNVFDPTDGTGDIDELGRIVPGARQLPPWTTGKAEGLSVLATWNAVIARVTRGRPEARLVDLHGLFMGRGLTAAREGRMEEYVYDPILEDPNDLGHRLIAERIWSTIVERDLPFLLTPTRPIHPAPPPVGATE